MKTKIKISTKIKEILYNIIESYVSFIGIKSNIIAGVNATYSNTKNLSKAISMFSEQKSREDIWFQTKWELGTEQKWKFEINDENARIKDFGFIKQIKLQNILNYRELFKNYPQLKDVNINFKIGESTVLGSYSKFKGISLNFDKYFTYRNIKNSEEKVVSLKERIIINKSLNLARVKYILAQKDFFSENPNENYNFNVEIDNYNEIKDDLKNINKETLNNILKRDSWKTFDILVLDYYKKLLEEKENIIKQKNNKEEIVIEENDYNVPDWLYSSIIEQEQKQEEEILRLSKDGLIRKAKSTITKKFKEYSKNLDINKKNKKIIQKWFFMDNKQEFLRTLLHEIQHIVQDIEGFNRGGSTEVDGKNYLFLEGEIEARNVETRLLLSKYKRSQLSPYNTADKQNGRENEKFISEQSVIDYKIMKATKKIIATDMNIFWLEIPTFAYSYELFDFLIKNDGQELKILSNKKLNISSILNKFGKLLIPSKILSIYKKNEKEINKIQSLLSNKHSNTKLFRQKISFLVKQKNSNFKIDLSKFDSNKKLFNFLITENKTNNINIEFVLTSNKKNFKNTKIINGLFNQNKNNLIK